MTKPSAHCLSRVWLISLILIGIALLFPFSDIQGRLSSGDHGRDLYAFAHAYDGKDSQVPYRDYWWVYGPAMPYYYGLFMKALGTSIHSVLVGQNVLLLIAGIFLALGIRTITGPAAGLAAAAWFWISFPGFFFTYNHTGGILLITAVVFGILAYGNGRNSKYLWVTALALLLLPFVKLNMGAALIAAALASLLLIRAARPEPLSRNEQRFILITALIIPAVVAAIHMFLLRGLSSAEIRECFPYSDADQQYITTPWRAILAYWNYFTGAVLANWPDRILAIAFLLSVVRVAWLAFQRAIDTHRLKFIGLALAMLFIIFTALQHEYLKSGVGYRFLWGAPAWAGLMFIVIGLSTQSLKKIWQVIIWAGFTVLILFMFCNKWIISTALRSENNYFKHPRANVYVINDQNWIPTVSSTAAFLQSNLKAEERFFAFPYDIIYYYLTDRLSPTRQTIFFQHINIPPDQEQKIIAELEARHVNLILASNRIASAEPGLGTFGRDYCPGIARYLDTNFSDFAQSGDWRRAPGWAWNHGTLILKRKTK